MRRHKFLLGEIVMTPGAATLPEDDTPRALFAHARGEWGEVSAEDKAINEQALKNDERLLSAWTTSTGVKFWIITEADRSVTTILLPEEY